MQISLFTITKSYQQNQKLFIITSFFSLSSGNMRRRLISVSINDPWQSSDHFDSQNSISLLKPTNKKKEEGALL